LRHCRGRPYLSGADGSAGDLGHIRAPRAEGITCTCGNDGCLEALAGGGALASRLREAGIAARDVHDVAALLHQVDRTATTLARQAGRDVGDVLASIVNFFNPSLIVIGGGLSRTGDQLLAGIRETIYRRSLPLATRELLIQRSSLGELAGVIGASAMVVDQLFARESIVSIAQSAPSSRELDA
jgi:predicted NBD/HSP70 family sugar kinase